MSDVVHVKLINGDDIVAKLIHEDTKGYIFESPMVVEERVNNITGTSVLVLVKYVHTGDNSNIELKKDHVLIVSPIQEVFEKYYYVSKLYNKKYIEPNIISEIEKVTAAMEDCLISPENIAASKSKLKSTSNNTIH